MSLDHARDVPSTYRVERLTVELSSSPAGPVVVASGELDASTAPVLAGPLRRAAGSEVPELVVDVRRLSFCDVAGLKLLAETANRLRVGGRRLVVLGPCPSLKLLLDLLGPAAPFELSSGPSA